MLHYVFLCMILVVNTSNVFIFDDEELEKYRNLAESKIGKGKRRVRISFFSYFE